MSKTPKELDAAVKMIFDYKPPKDTEEQPDPESSPEESEESGKTLRRRRMVKLGPLKIPTPGRRRRKTPAG